MTPEFDARIRRECRKRDVWEYAEGIYVASAVRCAKLIPPPPHCHHSRTAIITCSCLQQCKKETFPFCTIIAFCYLLLSSTASVRLFSPDFKLFRTLRCAKRGDGKRGRYSSPLFPYAVGRWGRRAEKTWPSGRDSRKGDEEERVFFIFSMPASAHFPFRRRGSETKVQGHKRGGGEKKRKLYSTFCV